ncbi:Acetyl-CoA hydrolase/transferase [Syntrophomonas zehnderi OL-4]|uniref:Probable butyrate:acetyl-CoA coenzyme A-transferase n=1 Tax=Syntrophomonas zehnderi OL-4 TaxID=690567 RepID=A0A0E4GUF9_9FIRM|nr:acetyl-CoA hydrolase/transferase C-terminal domain-containing protein [Syntrophomonas zehnderi]CQB51959.1 Acetyl-CoA hydrolase/transferase [Syntrophomonas zehnderi OL-4]
MTNANKRLYEEKLLSADKAAEVVKSGDKIFYSEFAMFPHALDEALAKRIDQLYDLELYSVSFTNVPKVVEADPKQEHIIMHDWHFGGLSRKLSDQGLCYYVPLCYSHGSRSVHKYVENDVAMICVAPMDNKGFFNLGTSNSFTAANLHKASTIIVEVNSSVPQCLGGNSENIHISNVDYIVEGNNNPLIQLPIIESDPVNCKIAEHIMPEIEDGCCLQLGIGGIPNVVGTKIAESDLKDLGIHTEMLVDSFVDMYETGRITGARKNIDRYKMVYTFAMGTDKLYNFLDNNPVCASYPCHYTNDPKMIALNDKVISINGAVEVDLFSQVSSESSGIRQISGTGGQLDFTMGAFGSHGGKGMICLPSAYIGKDGKLHSRIVPALSRGSIVTTPRSVVQYIVTENGIALLKGKSTWKRAEALIEIAHPQFQDELIKEAQEMRIWVRSNRIE